MKKLTGERSVTREVTTGVEISLFDLLEFVGEVSVEVSNDYGSYEGSYDLHFEERAFEEADKVTATVPSGKSRKTVDLSDIILKIEFSEDRIDELDETDC